MRKSREKILEELGEALLKVIYENPPSGLSVPYLHISLASGRVDDAIEYLKNPDRWVAGRNEGSES